MTPNLEKRTEMGNLIDAPEHTLTAIDEGIPLSHLIRRRLESAGARFHANDNIAAHLRDGELDALQNEVTQGMEAVLRSLVIDVDNDHNTRETARRVAKMFIREVFAGRRGAVRHRIPERRAAGRAADRRAAARAQCLLASSLPDHGPHLDRRAA